MLFTPYRVARTSSKRHAKASRPARRRHPLIRLAGAQLVCSLVLPFGRALAQSADTGSAQCFGFSFGAWHPALDLALAGHSTSIPDQALLKAPGGRDWASDAIPNDTTLLLFPAWWPAGVHVTFPRRPRAGADTVSGDAVALVANGQLPAPRARLRAWRVACR